MELSATLPRLRLAPFKRLRAVLILCAVAGYVPDLVFVGGRPWFLYRALALGAAGLAAFGVLERWPRLLPRGVARWAVQVLGVAAAMPLTTFALWFLLTPHGAPPFWQDRDRLMEFGFATFVALLLAPWTALAALVRQKEAFARDQAVEFELTRSELERAALDARLHLLQAQVAPHFLFNTLANIQALVEAGSPRAASVLRSLIAYLRAAVPRLNAPEATLGQELELVRAYLDLMHMRMPDRLSFSLEADEGAGALPCPPFTLLTLVENAIRHGIDPSEDGGTIAIDIRRRGGRCHMRVADTGVGLLPGGGGGTGLATLRQRLALCFGGDASLLVTEVLPHGVCAEVDFPVGVGA